MVLRYEKDTILLENVQRRATRMLRYLGDKNNTERMKELNIPTLEYRRQRSDLRQSYKLLNNIDQTSTKILKINSLRSTKGKKFMLYKERFNTEIRRSTVSNRVVHFWNSLPQKVVDAPTLNSFTSRLNSQWISDNMFRASCDE